MALTSRTLNNGTISNVSSNVQSASYAGTTPYRNWGQTANGSFYVTNPLSNYSAFKSEVGLDNHYGQASFGPMVRGQSRLQGGAGFSSDGITVPSSYSSNPISNYQVINGTGVGISARVQWDLGARQAQMGEPEWARKEMTNFNAPVNLTGAVADEFKRIFGVDAPNLEGFQAAHPFLGEAVGTIDNKPVVGKYEFFGDPQNSREGAGLGGRNVSTTYTPVDSFNGHVINSATGQVQSRQLDTKAENVWGYGIPSIGEKSRFAPLGSVEAQTGTFFGPDTHISAKGYLDPLQQSFEIDKFNTGFGAKTLGYTIPTGSFQSSVNDYKSVTTYWGANAGSKYLSNIISSYYK